MDITKTQNLLIQHLTVDLANILIEEQKKTIEQALNIVYNSTTFQKICDIKTGLYRESAGYNYDILQDELKHGKFGQYNKYE
ncbi:MAG: hypothetical protein LBC03_01235 [Nitrososphaerota archaeon]|jgi:hypothetical protein|nr:hypothetical protein [Nitrososphaerota archaeon]